MQNPSFLPLRSASTVGFASLCLLASCDSGADVGTFTGDAPPLVPLAVDFDLRTDVYLGATMTSDAIPVDLNGDGRMDIVEANFLDGTIRASLQDPLGGFGLSQTVAGAGGAVWRLGKGDVDGDGLVDVVAVEVPNEGLPGSTAGVTAFLQNAPGSFGTVLSLPLAGDPIDVDVIPGDASALPGGVPGAALITVAETGADRVALVRFDGADLELAGTLSSAVLGLGSPLTVAAVDVANDGLVDLIVGEIDVAGDLPDRIVVYPASGAGFGAPVALASSAVPILESIGDVDGNGYDDAAAAQLDASTVQVLLFDAAGLLEIQEVVFPGGSSSVVFGDFDVDGLPDVAATILGTQEILVRHGEAPAGEPLAFSTTPLRLNAGFLPRAVAAVDLSNDGVLDLLCPSNDDVGILLGDGEGDFRAAHGYFVGDQPVLVRCADLDGDDDQDVVTIDILQRQVGFLENDGVGRLTLVAETPFEVPAEIELPGGFDLGDINGDERPDLVVALHAVGELRVYSNPGTVAGFGAASYDAYPIGNQLFGVALADVNEDEALDVVVACAGNNTARILLNEPGEPGQLTEKPAVSLPFAPGAVIARDLDGNGTVDLAFTGVQGGEEGEGVGPTAVIGMLSGDGFGNFVVGVVEPVQTLGVSLDAGDFNDDGVLDLVVGQPSLFHHEVWVHLSNAPWSYEGAPYELGWSPGAVQVADVNRDGRQDLLVPSGDGQLYVAFGDGLGAFPVVEPPSAGSWPVPVGTVYSAFADVTGDGLEDLVMVSGKTPNVWVSRNVSVEIPTM